MDSLSNPGWCETQAPRGFRNRATVDHGHEALQESRVHQQNLSFEDTDVHILFLPRGPTIQFTVTRRKATMKHVEAIASVALLLASIGLASAQSFPNRTITLIVPYAAGGGTDLTARIVGEHLSATLGQPVVIENVTGGGSLIATGRVIRSTPDGHRLLVHQLALAANVSLYPKAPFNAERDLAGVGLINYSPMMIAGRTSLAANSISELISWMKQPGERARFAHAGAGSAAHLCAALFANSIGAQIELIPYRGAAQAVSDIVAGHVDLFCTPLGARRVCQGRHCKRLCHRFKAR